jgi:glycine cleavage system H protein
MAAEAYPQDLKYHSEHDWARVEGDEAVFGITWFAQDALGEVVYAELPALGAAVVGGQSYAELESVKTVSKVYAPASGQVIDRNEVLIDEPDKVNSDCYGEGWMIRVHLSDPSELDRLMDAEAYEVLLNQA